ncbi:MAG TPA: hypothetical protein VGI40_27165 [Pirellulaceae bacterium]
MSEAPSTAGCPDPSTVSAAALRLDPLLRKIRDGLSLYLEAFALAIQGARRQDIKWPLFARVVPDSGDGGTIHFVQQEPGDFVGYDNFGIYNFNIPVSEADIETAASYLRRCGLDPDAQRLLEVFKALKAAFCSAGDFISLSDGLKANRKFYAQDRALMLSEQLEDLIRTLPTILTPAAKSSEAGGGDGGDQAYRELRKWAVSELKGKQRRLVELLAANNGIMPIPDLKLACEWKGDEFARCRQHVNRKLRKAGWTVERHDNEARLRQVKGRQK